jgi:predicted phage baseplate assembly protein
VFVTEEDGQRKEWRQAPGNSLLTATKDDRVFVVDPVEGTLSFGNGIRGRMVPAGHYNIAIEAYHVIPGEHGNVGPNEVSVIEGYADMLEVKNVLPATGGRNSESIEEIIRRAPSVLTSRDRAVTRMDFEVIARESSAEVARAACNGKMDRDGDVDVVILPHRRADERTPDPFLATGLKEHVQRYLGRRSLVNVSPTVRLAQFQEVDVSVSLRLRPNANFVQLRETASQWVKTFLDPYTGGLDGQGWPFGGALYAQDFGRMVKDLPEVRHVSGVRVYAIDNPESTTPGWDTGTGQEVLVLPDHLDLFILRNVRVVAEEDGR